MSDDEIFATWAGIFTAAFGWIRWYLPILRLPRLGARTSARMLLAYVPPACMALLFLLLRAGASFDVRDSAPYLFMYMVMGAGWVSVALMFVPWLGLSPRGDVVERDNLAAARALAGAALALTLCYAGGNIGDGPGWWVVIFCATLATLTLALLWHLLEQWGHVAEQVTVERDAAAGTRVAGFLVACGLVLGRAVAGDWTSAGATLRDFVTHGWPVLVLLALAIVLERRLRATVEQPVPDRTTHGVLPALLYLGLALLWVGLSGDIA